MNNKYSINTKYRNNKEQGVVLVVALVFLVALTAVAAALMQNTTTDIKMAGATQEKSKVTQETISEMERVIFNEFRRVDGENALAQIIVGTINFNDTVTEPNITTATAINANQFQLDPDCPRAIQAISNDEVGCSIKRVQVTRTYGRDNNHSIQVNSGIAQVIKKGN